MIKEKLLPEAHFGDSELFQALSFISSVAGEYSTLSPRQKRFPKIKGNTEINGHKFYWDYSSLQWARIPHDKREGVPWWWLEMEQELDGKIVVNIIEQFAPPEMMYAIIGYCSYHNFECGIDQEFFEVL